MVTDTKRTKRSLMDPNKKQIIWRKKKKHKKKKVETKGDDFEDFPIGVFESTREVDFFGKKFNKNEINEKMGGPKPSFKPDGSLGKDEETKLDNNINIFYLGK